MRDCRLFPSRCRLYAISFGILTVARFNTRVVIQCSALFRNEDFVEHQGTRDADPWTKALSVSLLFCFFCMQIIRHLPTYVAFRALSLFSREIPPRNKIACNIIPDSPVSASFLSFSLPNRSERRPSIRPSSIHRLSLSLAVWTTGCIFDAHPQSSPPRAR